MRVTGGTSTLIPDARSDGASGAFRDAVTWAAAWAEDVRGRPRSCPRGSAPRIVGWVRLSARTVCATSDRAPAPFERVAMPPCRAIHRRLEPPAVVPLVCTLIRRRRLRRRALDPLPAPKGAARRPSGAAFAVPRHGTHAASPLGKARAGPAAVAGGDAQLAEDAAEVGLNGARAQEQLCADLPEVAPVATSRAIVSSCAVSASEGWADRLRGCSPGGAQLAAARAAKRSHPCPTASGGGAEAADEHT
ncbi:hypothetical protein SVIOM342S_04074 [Streptomyces violaceorubidus]